MANDLPEFRGTKPEPLSRYVFNNGPLLWFEFGKSSDGKTVDIADNSNSSLLEKVPSDLAKKIIEEHNAVVNYLESCYYEGRSQS